MQLFADYHTHTVYSHGSGTVLDNVWAAKRRGLTEVAIADHGPANLFGVGVADLDVFARLRQEVDAACRLAPGVKALLAVEANVVGTDGRLDIPLPMQGAFDLVLAGLHMLVRPHSWRDAAWVAACNILAKAAHIGERAALVANTEMLVNAVYRNKIDIVTHPGYRLPIDTKELAKACAATGTALEINTSHTHTTLRYLRVAAQVGARFAIGSDAHEPSRVGDLQAGVELAKRAGIEPEQVVNAVALGRDSEGRREITSNRRMRHVKAEVPK